MLWYNLNCHPVHPPQISQQESNYSWKYPQPYHSWEAHEYEHEIQVTPSRGLSFKNAI